MKKINPRVLTVLMAGIALVALLLLSASLSGLRFAEGKPIPIGNYVQDLQGGEGSSSLFGSLLVVFRWLMIATWVLLPMYIVLLFISKDARKRFLRDVLIFLPVLVLLYFLSNNLSSQKTKGEEIATGGAQPQEPLAAQPPSMELPEFKPPPAWVATAASLALAGVTAALIGGAVFLIWRRGRRKEHTPLERIQREARSAINSIEAGGDLRDTILRCYLQMIEALREYRSIDRDQAMTPHEFQRLLEGKGLPGEPVRELTDLFERVRYGAHTPGRQEEHAAVASLSSIISACERTSKRTRA